MLMSLIALVLFLVVISVIFWGIKSFIKDALALKIAHVVYVVVLTFAVVYFFAELLGLAPPLGHRGRLL